MKRTAWMMPCLLLVLCGPLMAGPGVIQVGRGNVAGLQPERVTETPAQGHGDKGIDAPVRRDTRYGMGYERRMRMKRFGGAGGRRGSR